MATAVELLILAYRLAALTFSLGALIYALPVPVAGLKRWAPRLIQDSILALVLIAGYEALLGASNMIASLIGGSWSLFYNWVSSGATEFIIIKIIILIIKLIPDPTGITDALARYLGILDRMATGGLYFLGFVAGLALLVKTYGRLLAAIGLVLYAVPFRLARNAGAWLFSFVIVFNAGLQVLPVLVVTLGGAPAMPFLGEVAEKGIAVASINATSPGGPLYGELHVTDYNTSEEYAVYAVDNGSAIDSRLLGSRSYVLIPSKPDIVYTLQYMGVEFYLAPYPARWSDYDTESGIWRITLTSPYTAYSSPGVLVYTSGYITGVQRTGNGATIELNLSAGQYVELRYADTCTASLEGSGLQVSSGEWEWRGVHGYYTRLAAPVQGEYTVYLSYTCNSEPSFAYDTHGYGGNFDKIISFIDLNFIRAYILYWFTVPILYIAMLWSITAALARLLGGGERFPIRFR